MVSWPISLSFRRTTAVQVGWELMSLHIKESAVADTGHSSVSMVRAADNNRDQQLLQHVATLGCSTQRKTSAHNGPRAPHGDALLVALELVVRRDGHLVAGHELERLVRLLQEAGPDLGALRCRWVRSGSRLRLRAKGPPGSVSGSGVGFRPGALTIDYARTSAGQG